ncbi:unnamed protein product, partial [Staurois parvus]
CTLPRKNNLSSNTHQIEHVQKGYGFSLFYQRGRLNKRRGRDVRIIQLFHTM